MVTTPEDVRRIADQVIFSKAALRQAPQPLQQLIDIRPTRFVPYLVMQKQWCK